MKKLQTFLIILLLIMSIILTIRSYALQLRIECLELIIEKYEIESATIIQAIQETNLAIPESKAKRILSAIRRSGRENNLPTALLTSIGAKESNFTQSAVSRCNAIGILQLMEPTFKEVFPDGDIHSLEDNIEAGARYLRKLINRFGDLRLALAAYNCGPSRTKRRILEISGGYADDVILGWERLNQVIGWRCKVMCGHTRIIYDPIEQGAGNFGVLEIKHKPAGYIGLNNLKLAGEQLNLF